MNEPYAPKLLKPLTPEEMLGMENPQIEPALTTEFDTRVDPTVPGTSSSGEVIPPLMTPAPTAQDTADSAREFDAANEDYTMGQYVSDVIKADWVTTNWFLGGAGPAPDPDFDLTPDHIKAFREQVPEYLWYRIEDSELVSQQHYDQFVATVKAEAAALDRLAAASGWGQAGRVALGTLDPVELGAILGTEALSLGTASPAIAARLGMRLRTVRGLMGAASNAGVGAVLNNIRDEDMSASDWGLSLGIDMVAGWVGGRWFGEAGDAIARTGTIMRAEARGVSETEARVIEQWKELDRVRRLGEDVDARAPSPAEVRGEVGLSLQGQPVPGPSTVGAAQAPAPEFIRPSVTLNPEATQSDVPVGAFPGWRTGVAGMGATSDDPIERSLIPFLGEDGAGPAIGSGQKGVTAATEEAQRITSSLQARWFQALKPAYTEFAKARGWGSFRRLFSSDDDFRQFSRQVRDYIEDERPNAASSYEPSVVRAGDRAREILADAARMMRNPGVLDGTTRRSVRGAENLAPDPFYFPKIADRVEIERLTATYGYNALRTLVREAVEDAMTAGGYVINPDLLDRVSDGYLKNLSTSGYGMGDELADIFAGRSASRMYEVLNAAGINSADVEQIVQAMDARDAAMPRLKHRSPINYKFTRHLKNLKTGEMEPVSPQMFFSDDVDHVLGSYSRRLAGDVSLARLRIKDPTQPESPDYWIDGITSRAEFEEKVIKAIRDSYQRRGAQGVDTAVKRAEFLYNATLGLPQHNLSSGLTRALRRVRDYNFLRLMNNMGITQSIELGRIFARTSFTAAFRHMPSVKRIIQQGTGDYVLNNKVARELEMWGITDNDYWIGASKYRFQQELIGESANTSASMLARVGNRYDDLVNKGKEVMANTSLMRPIHSRMQQWAARATLQWFADLSADPKKFKRWANRLNDMGLDSQDMGRIRQQISRFAESPDPDKRKITAMNFDKWDPEVRSVFLNAVRKYANRIVQVNDPGNLPMVFEHPVAKTFLQFRGFVFSAYEKSTLWDLKHNDTMSLMTAVGDVVFGAASFAALVHAKALTRDDREEYLEKELSPENLLLMGWARSGTASFTPMVWDSAMSLFGQDPWFMGSRTSGTATDVLGGSAPVDLYNSVLSASGAAVNSWTDWRDLSKQELGTALRIMPGGNWLPAVGLLNALSSGREQMAPPREREE